MVLDGDDEGVVDDGDFLLALAEESARERRIVADGPSSPRAALIARAARGEAGVLRGGAAAAGPALNSPGAGTCSSRGGAAARPPSSWPGTQPAPRPILPSTNVTAMGAFYIEEHSGLKVSRPIIGSSIVKERLSYRTFIRLGDVGRLVGVGLNAEWATIAVLVSKTQHEGRNGAAYSRWRLSDLRGDCTASCGLFVFGDAHRQLYKESEGSVLMLLNPKASKDKGGGGGGGGTVSLSVDNPDQVCVIGASPDLGTCKGTTQAGARCKQVVNLSVCDYCPFHAAAALRRLQSAGRPDLKGRSFVEAQLRPQALKAEAMARKSTPATPAAHVLSGSQLRHAACTLKPGAEARAALGGKRNRGVEAVMAVADAADGGPPAVAPPAASGAKRARPEPQRGGGAGGGPGTAVARPVHRSLPAETRPAREPAEPEIELDDDDQDNDDPRPDVGRSGDEDHRAGDGAQQEPQQQQGVACMWAKKPLSEAKARLLAAVMAQRTPDEAPGASANPPTAATTTTAATRQPVALPPLSLGRSCATAPASAAGARRVGLGANSSLHNARLGAAASQPSSSRAKPLGTKPPPPRGPLSAMAAAFGDVVAKALAEEPAQSRYHELGEASAWDDMMGRLGQLERKDALAQQAQAVMSLKVSAWHCADCGFTVEARPGPACSAHRVTRVSTTKRFWRCSHCGARSASLGVLYPSRRCPKCNDPGMDFKAVPMCGGPRLDAPTVALDGSNTGIAARENLMPRGVEHGFALQ